MKYRLTFLSFYFLITGSFAQSTRQNLALHLDGKDNDVRIGMGIIKSPWTLEAWIKGDDTVWKSTEVIFGGGEYSELNIADNLPLVIDHGRLHSSKAGLWSKHVLDNNWHHVAISCDGRMTFLYLDGEMIDSAHHAFSVLPGALGTYDNDSTTFGGLIDEVRIWHAAIDPRHLREWMAKPLDHHHPDFQALKGYYNFDEGFKDIGINRVGKGNQPYHLRNGRYDYKSNSPLAYTVINNNPKFTTALKRQQLFNAVLINNEWDADQGTTENQVLKLRIAVDGTENPLSLTELKLDLADISHLSDIEIIHVYYAGHIPNSGVRTELFGKGRKPSKSMTFSSSSGQIPLSTGINYFLVTADIAKTATVGDTIKISVPSFKLNDRIYTPETANDPIRQTITSSSKTNPHIIKVLQWNIWHGGVHLGNNGLARVIDLIKATHADIITMQEAYGSQKRIADSLGFHMHTASSKDNLAVFSRYPIDARTTNSTFNSNPVMIKMPDDQPILINGCWLRYASDPEYTSIYPNTGLDPNLWTAADSSLGLIDMQHIIENDTKPIQQNKDIPVIIGGDFNSGSHLDWTGAAAPLHYGYGPVLFPTSQYLLKEGYKDSFREMNPDEVAHPEGTWAAIYGQSQNCRIDFIYYKGKRIRALSSKIIRTAPEIDDVWASDHAAVLTTFEVANE